MPKNNIDIKAIKKALNKTVWFFGERAFVSFIIFVFLASVAGGAIFYYYGFLVAAQESEEVVESIKLDDESYQGFIENYQRRTENFVEANFKLYSNPFTRSF